MAIKNTLTHNEAIQTNTAFIQTLQKHFPQFFTVNRHSEHSEESPEFDIEKFKTELAANNIHEAKDGYALNFVGKDYARLLSGQKSETVIVPDNDHNTKPENASSENVFITGDNLEALRHLQNAYSGAIKMIYIDPPYNTGKEFVYNDKFSFTDEKLKTALGYTDKEIERLKSLQGKSSHSAWLTFMYPRLKIAQNLLADDGVIFISIDDNEQANLKLLMDDIFGEGQYITSAPRKTGAGAAATSSEKELRKLNDYIFIYAKNNFFFKQKIVGEKTYPFEDENGKYNLAQFQASGSDATRAARPNMYYPIFVLSDGTLTTIENEKIVKKILPNKINGLDGRWMWQAKKFETDNKKFISYVNEKLERKVYFDENEDQTKYQTEKAWFEQFPNSTGTTYLNDLMETKGLFSNPKPIELIKFLINLIEDQDFIIMDFFAGSATTADAVLQTNKDGGKRKFLMVQWAETLSSETAAFNAGYKTIDEISRERIKRAAKKIKADNPSYAENADLGFKHYRLQEPQVQTIDKIVEFNPNIQQLFAEDMVAPFAYKPTNTSGLQTILQTWLVQDGHKFNIQAEAINLAGYEAQYVNQTLYLINTGFTHESLKTLLNKIGKNELIVNTIILYPYSFSFEEMRELKYNIKTNVEQQVTIIERY